MRRAVIQFQILPLHQILKTYDTYGYKFLVFTGNDHEATERKYIQELLSYKIEGMIILSHTIPSRELASYNLPIVTIEREDQFVSSVNTDNYMGAVQATSLLAKTRSEERRVGKECRSRWSPYH